MEGLIAMKKSEVYIAELAKIQDIFKGVEDTKRRLVEGLMEDAAFLRAENTVIKESLSKGGMVKSHPKNPDIQKSTEAAKQYLRNVNSYAVVIKALNSVLSKDITEEDGDLDEFE